MKDQQTDTRGSQILAKGDRVLGNNRCGLTAMNCFAGVNHCRRSVYLHRLHVGPVTRRRNLSASAESKHPSATTKLAGGIFFSGLCIGTFGLGVWQTQRYFEKVEMLQKRDDDLSFVPVDFNEWQTEKIVSKEGDESDGGRSYRRVRLQGKFQHVNEVLVGLRGPPAGALSATGPNSGRGGGMSSGTQGYMVVTPLVISVPGAIGGDNGAVTKLQDHSKDGWFHWRRRPGGDSPPKLSGGETDNDKPSQVVWINRGWIPRHYVDSRGGKTTDQWEKPSHIVQITAMESTTETPGRFTPSSRIDSRQTFNKLLWIDRDAIEDMTSVKKGEHPPLFVEIETGKSDTSQAPCFPVKPSVESVGEFKVTPSVHAGYAFTWFGLSSAGVYMTRRLLLRR